MFRQALCLSVVAAFVWTFAAFPAAAKGAEENPSEAMTLPGVDVVIDVGHGGIDGGTSYRDILEKDINLQISKRLLKELQKRGFRTITNRAADYALSDDNRWLASSRHKRDLAQRSEIANQLNPRLMVSLHCNWSPGPKKKGPLVLFQKNGKSRMLAQIVQSELNRLYGTHEVPEIGKAYYVLNHTRSSTIIVEMGFLSNEEDRALLVSASGQERIASVLSEAITQYLWLGGLY